MDKSVDKSTPSRAHLQQLQHPQQQQQQQQHSQSPHNQPQISLPPHPSLTLHPTSRRPSSINVREALPTPPPDPRENENIFKFPPTKQDLFADYQSLFNYVENQEEFHKTLNKIIAQDCAHQASHGAHETHGDETASSADDASTSKDEHRCAFCQHLRHECKQFIDPLHNRLGATLSALLASHGAMEQLTRLYAMWDKYFELAHKWQQQKERLHYVNLLHEKMRHVRGEGGGHTKNLQRQYSDTEADVEQSIALIESILAETGASTSAQTGGSNTTSTKRGTALKHQRERSKSVMVEDLFSSNMLGRGEHERDVKSSSTVPQLLRRQSTYSECKSKVSKWTKVKAAFKWERANVPALGEGGQRDLSPNGVGLTPINHEVARYLRVPSAPSGGGGSSADSILSSSSGHFLSEAGTPGTISSASSMDDIDSSGRSTMRRDSTKSDTRLDSRASDDAEVQSDLQKSEENELQQKPPKGDVNTCKMLMPTKSSSIKSLRRGKTLSDFEVLPEDGIAEIKSTPTRKTRPPPSPLNLNLKQDLNDVDFSYSPYSLKSPKEGTQSLTRTKKISSPGNSSVPSSPSRHSDFFAEFESEDLSSGDFSEPTTPSHMSSHKSFYDKQQEINQRYQMLRAKLDMEFEAKRREWEKMKMNTNACRAIALITPPKQEEHIQTPAFSANLSAKLLEENLTPDFKKKLRKWRVKKQISVSSTHAQQTSPTSPNRDVGTETKSKIDWNLWKTGQLKLEGQGLTPLPDQKDLPEEFQKKLEQWNKIKRGGGGSAASSVSGGQDSIKRSNKHSDGGKKSTEDATLEKDKRGDKHKPHEKDKLEKLAKLKAIVTDHPTKEIEVKTSEGVMKFEGISRKFTRKLYEWEKARGIGPESSTFALLHPGYRPLVVDRISKESHTSENSPTLSRSFSLDSIAPNVAPPGISHQASSLSLNDVNELKDIEGMTNADAIGGDSEFKKFDEPEAVMVEVEDHIEETASPLVTAHTLVEQQTPIYKYEEVTCSDFCNTRRVQSFESHTNLAPLLSALQRTDEIFSKLKQSSPEMAESGEVCSCESVLSFIRSIYPYYSENLMKPNVLNAISDVQSELCRISELCERSPLDEACCQETILERNFEYNEELKGLHEALELLRQSIHGGSNRFPKDIVPDINITTVDVCPPSADVASEKKLMPAAMEMTDELSASLAENDDTETASTTQRIYPSSNGTNGAGKKKLRLRKMGSRQNSKTESDSTDEDAHSVLETPRRLKRKNFRLKQRSFDDDYRKIEAATGDDVVYVLKVKPGHPIEQSENCVRIERSASERQSLKRGGSEKCLVTTKPMQQMFTQRVELLPVDDVNINQNANVFVKTKRKVFTTVEQPNAIEGIVAVARDVEHLQSDIGIASKPLQLTEVPKEHENHAHEKKDSKISPYLQAKKPHPIYKSLSHNDVRQKEFDCEEERRCHSVEKLSGAVLKLMRGVRPPLAYDSFKALNKSCTSLLKETTTGTAARSSGGERQDMGGASPAQQRKEHRYKKNTDKTTHQTPFTKSQSATIKKIETKLAKTNSGTSIVEIAPQTLAPDKMDNTLPRILRKLERKSLTPNATQQPQFDYPSLNNSEPPSPLPVPQPDAPHTPLSERAQRLLKAKEEFLQNSATCGEAEVKRRDDIVRNDNWEKYRCSDYSLSSATTGGDLDLAKSVSADTITADSFTETPTQSDAGTDQDVGLYDSLPRAVTRSGKISSKLGFATLASKFRRGKGGKKDKDTGSVSGSALSALCRQTLLADVIASPQLAVEARGGIRRPVENVKKSKSSPQAGHGVEVFPAEVSDGRREKERLNKSQSEQFVKRPKESLV